MIALTPTGLFWYMAVGALIWAFPLPPINVSIQTILQTVVPVKMFARVNSVVMALANIASPLGMAISGPIAEVTGTANLFLGCSLLGILSITLSWLFTDIRHVEKIEEEIPHPNDQIPVDC